jgi:hypothetical protein
MKTTTNHNRASKMANVLITVIVFSTSAMAQPFQNESGNEEIQASFDRLEAIMSSIGQAVRYTAPSAEYDEMQSALNRLDLLARETETNIRYKAPEEVQFQVIEYAVEENDLRHENPYAMALKIRHVKNNPGDPDLRTENR